MTKIFLAKSVKCTDGKMRFLGISKKAQNGELSEYDNIKFDGIGESDPYQIISAKLSYQRIGTFCTCANKVINGEFATIADAMPKHEKGEPRGLAKSKIQITLENGKIQIGDNGKNFAAIGKNGELDCILANCTKSQIAAISKIQNAIIGKNADVLGEFVESSYIAKIDGIGELAYDKMPNLANLQQKFLAILQNDNGKMTPDNLAKLAKIQILQIGDFGKIQKWLAAK